MALQDDLRSIQLQISQVQAKKARATVESDNATAKRATAKSTLKQEFGVETTEDAKAMQVKLEEALDSAVLAVRKALAESGASV